jgi:hypothetical protein
MTQLIRDQIPLNIGTVEQLIVWGTEVLNNLYTDIKAVEGLDIEGQPVKARVVDVTRFYVDTANDKGWRYVTRFSFPLRKEYQQEGKVWQHIASVGDLPVPPPMRIG